MHLMLNDQVNKEVPAWHEQVNKTPTSQRTNEYRDKVISRRRQPLQDSVTAKASERKISLTAAAQERRDTTMKQASRAIADPLQQYATTLRRDPGELRERAIKSAAQLLKWSEPVDMSETKGICLGP